MNKYKAMLAGVALMAVPALCSAGIVYQQDFESYTNGTPGSNTVMWSYSGDANQTSVVEVNTYNGSKAFIFTENGAAANGTSWYWYAGFGTDFAYDGGLLETTSPADVSVSFDVALVGATAPINFNLGQWDPAITNNSWTATYVGSMPTDGSVTTVSFTLDTVQDGGTWDPAKGLNFSAGFNNGQFGLDDGNQVIIDNIMVTVIPEPATIGLVAFAGAGVLFVRRRFRV